MVDKFSGLMNVLKTVYAIIRFFKNTNNICSYEEVFYILVIIKIKKMKRIKQLFIKTVLLMFLVFFTTGNLLSNEGDSGVPFTCESSINEVGPLIIVTVCNRRPTLFGTALGLSCESSSTEECTFTNHAIPM